MGQGICPTWMKWGKLFAPLGNVANYLLHLEDMGQTICPTWRKWGKVFAPLAGSGANYLPHLEEVFQSVRSKIQNINILGGAGGFGTMGYLSAAPKGLLEGSKVIGGPSS